MFLQGWRLFAILFFYFKGKIKSKNHACLGISLPVSLKLLQAPWQLLQRRARPVPPCKEWEPLLVFFDLFFSSYHRWGALAPHYVLLGRKVGADHGTSTIASGQFHSVCVILIVFLLILVCRKSDQAHVILPVIQLRHETQMSQI